MTLENKYSYCPPQGPDPWLYLPPASPLPPFLLLTQIPQAPRLEEDRTEALLELPSQHSPPPKKKKKTQE